MKKVLCLSFLLIVAHNIWASPAPSPSRGPSVEPMSEVDIEADKKSEAVAGYDFATSTPSATPKHVGRVRVPANIVTKENANSPYSYIGPFIFLITLPIAVWIMVSKKFKSKETKDVGYYGKTHQFNTRQAEYNDHLDDDHDDVDYPKAS